MTDEIKRIPIKEFREHGYLQEINRRLLHPLGLALEVLVAPDGTETLGGVWDYRDDPEGIYYRDDVDLKPHTSRVAREWLQRRRARRDALGYMIQDSGDR